MNPLTAREKVELPGEMDNGQAREPALDQSSPLYALVRAQPVHLRPLVIR